MAVWVFFSEVQGLFSSLLLLCFCFVLISSILTCIFLGDGVTHSSLSSPNIVVSYTSSSISTEAETNLMFGFFPNLFLGFPKMKTTNVFGFLSSTVMPDS